MRIAWYMQGEKSTKFFLSSNIFMNKSAREKNPAWKHEARAWRGSSCQRMRDFLALPVTARPFVYGHEDKKA